jgi:hypothetical protein
MLLRASPDGVADTMIEAAHAITNRRSVPGPCNLSGPNGDRFEAEMTLKYCK